MPRERFPIRDIQSFMPSIDVRNTEEPYVLSGRNYVFDTKGPKSGFGSRLVCGLNSIEVSNGSVQDVSIAERTFVCSTQGIYELAENEQSWIQHVDFNVLFEPEYIPFLDQQQWTGAYLSDGVYLCHKTFGFYKLTREGFDKITVEDLAGFPERPIAIAETNGRLIVLNQDFVAWSAPSQAERFVPELGGAGQQRLSDRVTGTPIAVVGFQRGFLVWTTEDCLLAEFVGGDTVFRFDRMTTDQIPVGPMAVEELPDGSQIICTKQGLYVTANGSEPKDVTPLFNQFIKDFLKNEPGIIVRLDYNMEYDHLYVQLRDWTNHHVRTYVVTVALDRWGEFNERHLGILRYSAKRGSLGYVDRAGVVHKFVETFNKEVTPHTFEGLDSQIDVGYVKPPRLVEEGKIDTLLEMQELFIGGVARPSWSEPTVIDCGEVPPITLDPAWAAYLRFHGEPIYWVKHAGAPEGEYFETREELLASPVALNANDIALGMKLSIPVGGDPDLFPQPSAQNELLEAIQALTASAEGITFVIEVDTALQHEADFLWMQDGPMDSIIRVLGWHDYPSGNFPNQRPNFARLYAYMEMLDEWGMDEFEPSAATHAWDVTRVAFSIKPMGGGIYRFALALNGLAVFSYDSASVYHPTWVPDLVKIGINSNSYVQDAGPVLYKNDSYLRKFIVYSDGDDAQVVARSILEDRAEILEVNGGNPVNANATTLEVTDGELQLLIPAATEVDDRLIAVVYGRSALTPPAGWTLVHSQLYERNYFWNADFPGGVMNRVDLALAQTTYIYTRVAEAGDAGAAVRWPFAVPGICGGVITSFRRPDGTTPEILNSALVKNQNDIDSGIELRVNGGLNYAYRGVEGTEFTSTRHDTVAFLAVVAGMVADCYHYNAPAVAEDFAMSEVVPDTTAQYIDEAALRPVFSESATGIGGASQPTMQGLGLYWQSWNYLTELTQVDRNRMLVAWKYLPRSQELVTRRVEGGQAKGMYFTHISSNVDVSSSTYAADPATVVGTLLIA